MADVFSQFMTATPEFIGTGGLLAGANPRSAGAQRFDGGQQFINVSLAFRFGNGIGFDRWLRAGGSPAGMSPLRNSLSAVRCTGTCRFSTNSCFTCFFAG